MLEVGKDENGSVFPPPNRLTGDKYVSSIPAKALPVAAKTHVSQASIVFLVLLTMYSNPVQFQGSLRIIDWVSISPVSVLLCVLAASIWL